MEWSGPPTLVQSVRAHRGEVSCLDVRGARLVTGDGRGALRLWAWAAGAGWAPAGEAALAHRYGATAVRWAAAGALLASGGVDGAARLWSRSLAARGTLAAPGAAALRALAWAGAGRLLAGHDDGVVCAWHVARGTLLARLEAHEGSVYALAVAARGALLFTACTNGVLKVYDLIELCRDVGVGGERVVGAGAGAGGAVAALAWVDGAHDMGALCADCAGDADRGALVATGGHDARVRLWRAELGGGGCRLEAAGALAGHAAAVTAVRWSRAAGLAPLLASASLDRTARLWDPAPPTCLHVLTAHPRYLTCVALADDLRYMVTGSNDKTVRMWALGELSLDEELEPPCTPLSHFAVGDLEGIGPVADEPVLSSVTSGAGSSPGSEEDNGSECLFSERAHAGAVNCIAVHDELVATASSDGAVKVWRWEAEESRLRVQHTLAAHLYPALAVDFAAGGSLLLTAGLDGCAFIWDVQSGVQVRSLSVPGAGASGGGGGGTGEAGGGGVRAARVSPRAPYSLLLGTDDGLAPLYTLASTDPDPIFVYGGHTEAVTCCAWSWDGRVAATGAASGELRVLAPPHVLHLHHESHAHDLGVLSSDFAPSGEAFHLPGGSYLLATGGCDSLVKLWTVVLVEDMEGLRAEVSVTRAVSAHGAAVASVRWSCRDDGVLVSSGADRWARVWNVTCASPGLGGAVRVSAAGAVPARGAGGALAASPLVGGPSALLALGALSGELAVWKVHAPPHDAEDCALPLHWLEADVVRWIREYIVESPGSNITKEVEEELMLKVHGAGGKGLTGVHLMDYPIGELLEKLGLEEEPRASRARDELEWLRRRDESSASAASSESARLEQVMAAAPHRLRCPLTHRVLVEPARAADGFTYDRAAILEWLLAAPPEGGVSPVTGARLASHRLAPNYALRDELRAFMRASHTPLT